MPHADKSECSFPRKGGLGSLVCHVKPDCAVGIRYDNSIHLDCVKSCRLNFTSASVSHQVPYSPKDLSDGLRKFSGKENGKEFKPKSLLV